MKDDEIALNGFLELNLMEAQDADGDPNDLWVTLESMGYNNALELDQVLISSNTQPLYLALYPYKHFDRCQTQSSALTDWSDHIGGSESVV